MVGLENQEQEQQEQQVQQEQEEQKQRMLDFYKKRLKKIDERLIRTKSTKLSIVDQMNIRKSKSFPELKKERNNITKQLTFNKTAKRMKTSMVTSFGSSGLMVIGIIVGVVLIVAIIMSLLPQWLVEKMFGVTISEEDGLPELGGSEFGITGEDFYGARVIYKNNEKATTTIIEDYVELVETSITKAQSITTITKDDKTFEIAVTINLTIPSEDFKYEDFNEEQFKSSYSDLYDVIYNIAKTTYKIDNSTDFTGTSLVECVDGIKHFGYNETIMNAVKETDDTEKVSVMDLVLGKSSFGITKNPTIEDGETLPTVEKADIDAKIKEELTTVYGDTKYNQRTEKLFIKDVILENSDSKIKNLGEENFVAFIFMPKTNVTFNSISFTIAADSLKDYTLKLTNNGNEISLEKDDSMKVESSEIYFYLSDENLNESVNTFNDIDTNKLNALSAGVSLFDIVENKELDYTKYLQVNENNILTAKKNGMVAEMNNAEKFSFSEREVVWEA